MTKIKICGLKRKADIVYVNQLKPDYVGFVFAKSSRQVEPFLVKELIEDLDSAIKRVGVFVNMDRERVLKIGEDCKLDVLQFHGEESPDYCSAFQQEVWKAFRVKDSSSLEEMKAYAVEGYLLDSYREGQQGGSGEVFSWELVQDMKKSNLFIAAGGLHGGNVREAIEIMKPHVVDVSSGVEENGIKCFEKMKDFIEKVREIS